MIKGIISSFNTKAGFFVNNGLGLITGDNIEAITEIMTRDLKLMSKEAMEKIKDIEIYLFGYFDDISGKIKLLENKEFILRVGDYYEQK